MKKSGLKEKMEEFSYDMNAKKGKLPVILKSLKEVDTNLAKMTKNKKK
ncbi:hypothetical protein [Novisyntrophococcus fermenticellae]|nr:hypothetical protein [Novisyntrophococcus fermenticellae]